MEAMEVEFRKQSSDSSDEDGDDENKKADSSSDEMSDDDSKKEEQASLLEKKVEERPYEYDSYVELIKILKQMGELERLRKAREKMSQYFPLTPEIWLSWLQDEIKLASTESERQVVSELFERAVQDYMSVKIWLEYAQFSIGDMSLQGGIERVYSIFDRALTAVGLHVARGSIIWEAYREFEIVLCSQKIALKQSNESGGSIYGRVFRLFKRQLSVPLLDMQNTYTEFQNWIAEVGEEMDTKEIERGYKKAMDKLSLILPFEEQLLSCPSDRRTSCYRQYIAHETSSRGDPARIQSLYERAIAEEVSPNQAFWLEYIEYLSDKLRIDSVVLAACKRAVRNCPWFSSLWQHYLRSLEANEKSHDEIKGVLEKAMAAGFVSADDYRELWISYIDYLRRRTDFTTEQTDRVDELIKCFEKAVEYMTEYFGLDGDPSCTILQSWARVEAVHRKNMTECRLLWNRILAQGHDKVAAMWLEYGALERCCGDADGKHLRRLYARALKSVQDWPESIGNAWLNYERNEGTLSQFETCLEAFKTRMKEVTARRQKLAAEELVEAHTSTGNRAQERRKRHEERGRNNTERGRNNAERGDGRELKRKLDDGGKWAGVAPRTEYVKKSTPKAETESAPEKSSRVAPPPGYKSNAEEAPQKKSRAAEEGDAAQVNAPVVHDSSKDLRTVFVSNLDFSVTEDEIREKFQGLGTLTDLRLVKDFKGRSKGFGYVEFSTQPEAAAALDKDRDPINGRPMFISKCDPDKQTRQTVFKYSNALEKNKLFVKGLPLSMTKEDLEVMFKAFGPLKEVRLVTYRNGHSKGLAYVDFEDSASAGRAVLKTDGMVISERTISVAISQPPERKNQSASLIPSLGGGGDREIGSRGRVKMAASLVPRSVQISQNASAGASDQANGQSANGGGDAKKMSNQDFRSMLLGSKK